MVRLVKPALNVTLNLIVARGGALGRLLAPLLCGAAVLGILGMASVAEADDGGKPPEEADETVTSVVERPTVGAPREADGAASADRLPVLRCTAAGTAGFHDYPGTPEQYHASVFNESTFTVEVNEVLQRRLQREGDHLFLTMLDKDENATEFTCVRARGTDRAQGYSCQNVPPSEMFLLNTGNWRYTRSSVGGYSLYGASAEREGVSLFVEYGSCLPQ